MHWLFNRCRRWWRASARQPPLLVFVEGSYDIEFLKRIGRVVRSAHRHRADLAQAAEAGRLLFVPVGGSNLGTWTLGLEAIGLRQFHLYDREMSPETELRVRLVDSLQAQPGAQARLTGKRSLENYLHPEAIYEACGVHIDFGDDDSVADRAAEAVFRSAHDRANWHELSIRSRKRLRNRAKRWLNTRAVEQMTVERLTKRDPMGEVISWLDAIDQLLDVAC